jgi:hypothetical protein
LATAGLKDNNCGHWVGGVASDSAGLPLLGWSTTGGDLRVAHFWALHAQQALPLFGAIVSTTRPQARTVVVLAAAAYVGLIAFTFVQALAGRAFIG